MEKLNEPEQLELDIDPVCQQTGCKHQTLFKAIRKLQAINAHLETYARHHPTCKQVLFGNDFLCTCGFSTGVTGEEQ